MSSDFRQGNQNQMDSMEFAAQMENLVCDAQQHGLSVESILVELDLLTEWLRKQEGEPT